ncbi:hypothetical protein FJZ53_02890, partial [Candidatus Woesearchaeota archaeon]|nr:hypothetical protein [Candidatus Woesearchaeota archaeon]
MKKIAIILALLLLLVSSASATVTVTGVSPLTATEDTAYAGTVTATSGDAGGITGYTLTGPAWLSVSNAGALTGTPLQANAGSNAFTVHVTDADGTADFPFTIAVAAANDAPVLSITDCTDEPDAVEDGEYTCTVTATDEDDTTLTFSLVSPPAGMAISATGAITWTPDDEQIGSHTITVKVEDDETPTKASDTETFTVFVRPQDVCEDYTGGTDLDIDEIDITDDDEDFYPGSKIEMEVSVENNDDEDLEEVVVEAILYDLDDGKILKRVKSE